MHNVFLKVALAYSALHAFTPVLKIKMKGMNRNPSYHIVFLRNVSQSQAFPCISLNLNNKQCYLLLHTFLEKKNLLGNSTKKSNSQFRRSNSCPSKTFHILLFLSQNTGLIVFHRRLVLIQFHGVIGSYHRCKKCKCWLFHLF